MKTCDAIQHSDQMVCETCNISWDVNDQHPPFCKPAKELALENLVGTNLEKYVARAIDIMFLGLSIGVGILFGMPLDMLIWCFIPAGMWMMVVPSLIATIFLLEMYL